ncbi:hypothetical protein RIVM261_078490 [Rivularia sp. IAM M-261]|nr:hypothetical protein RIVM261_078490 [Rivularia sp. IAM M-261]
MHESLVENNEFKDSPLGKIPNDWETFKMASFASIKYGINDAIDQTLESGVSTITLPCVKSTGELVLNKDTLGLTIKNKVFSDDFLERGDLLFNWRNGSQEHLGKTAYFDVVGEYTHVGFLLRIRTKSDICYSRYLWWQLCFIKYQGFFLKAKSQVNNTFNSAELADVRVIIPPLKEQQRIAEILDTVDNTIAHTSDLITKLKQTKAGLLHDLLTCGLNENGQLRNPETHPEQFKDSVLGQIPIEWEIISIGELGSWKGGLTPSKLVASNWTNGNVLWISPKDFKEGEISDSEDKITEKALINSNLSLFEAGDIIVVFRSSILRHKFPVAVVKTAFTVNQDIKVLQPNAGVCRKYVFFAMQHMGLQILKSAVKAGTTVESVDLQTFCDLPFILPSKKEQEKIITILDIYDARISKEEVYLNKLKLQKQGLMQDLLTGKVRVKSIKQ